MKTWRWLGCDYRSYEDWQYYLKKLHKNHIDNLLVNGSFLELERMLPIAEENGMKTHAWLWIVNQPKTILIKNHPDWFMINKKGISCADQAPYVGYYRWLCPSKKKVRDYIKELIRPYLDLELLSGIHFDYIRYPDVILPIDLQKKYGIDQYKELDEYDFCYCSDCRDLFYQKTGLDIHRDFSDEEALLWKQFRYDNINQLVNELSEYVRSYSKKISAAVFPTPEIALKLVRQEWKKWDLDIVFPMLYHRFYHKDIEWIGQGIIEGKDIINPKIEYCAGLHLPFFENSHELIKAIEICRDRNCEGVSFFGNSPFDFYSVLKDYINCRKE